VNKLQRSIQKLDRLQQRHHFSAFAYAVIKRYGEDQAGYQAALLTYYAFLALFPLLLVLTTLTQIIATAQPGLQANVITSVTNTFPVLGGQLSAHVHSLHKNGLALVTGLLFVVYGTRGVADVFRNGVNHIWQVPRSEQGGFPQSALKSLTIMTVGGAGIIVASVTAGLTAAAGHAWPFRLMSFAVNLIILYWIFMLLFRISLPRRIPHRELRTGAAAAAVGLVILQSAGSYLLSRELKSLDALYSYFALALGLIFWIYLQAQIVYYSAEIAVVKSRRLWPRSFSS
jgi:YihY family inner membrane protein